MKIFNNIKGIFSDISPSDIITLPITLFENFSENMKDEMEIKSFYKSIIISNILFIIVSILLHKYSICFYYSLGSLVLIFFTLKLHSNDMHERAFMKIWKKFKDTDYGDIKDKIAQQGKTLRSSLSNPFNKSEKYDDTDDENEDIDDDGEDIDGDIDDDNQNIEDNENNLEEIDYQSNEFLEKDDNTNVLNDDNLEKITKINETSLFSNDNLDIENDDDIF